MRVSGSVHVDLRGMDEESRRRSAGNLTSEPADTIVVLFVGDLWPDWDVVERMRVFGGHLGEIRVLADDAGTADRWVQALRNGFRVVA